MTVWLCGSVLFFSILLGGGTHAGFMGDVLVQLLSVPLLAISLWSFFRFKECSDTMRRVFVLISCAILFVFAIQLCPLPFEVSWFEKERGAIFDFLGIERPWSQISTTPQATWFAAASLIPPFAIFFAALQLSTRHRFLLAWLILAMGGFSLLIGFLQMAQGPGSPLRFYDVTNSEDAVGLFANRNHFAALLYVTLVLSGVWYAKTMQHTLTTGGMNSRSVLWSAAAAVLFVSVVAGLAMARSRAAVFLALIALVSIVLIIVRQRKLPNHKARFNGLTVGRMSILAVVISILFAAQFGADNLLSRFDKDPFADFRVTLTKTTFVTALQALPFGTGLGSFTPVYAMVEKDSDLFSGYANRAHNDLAEILLETGLPGLILLFGFLAWFFRKAHIVLFTRSLAQPDSQIMLQRAATLIIFLLLLHSLVDYPLRTTALSSIFVFFCAVLTINGRETNDRPTPARERHVPKPTPQMRTKAPERWVADQKWPGEWYDHGREERLLNDKR